MPDTELTLFPLPDEWQGMPRRRLTSVERNWDAPFTEAQLLAKVIRYAREHGALFFHVYHGSVTCRGFVDLVIAGPGGVGFVELKTLTGLLSPAQQAWREMLLASGQAYTVITPAEWASGAAQQWLRRVAGDEEWEDGEEEAEAA